MYKRQILLNEILVDYISCGESRIAIYLSCKNLDVFRISNSRCSNIQLSMTKTWFLQPYCYLSRRLNLGFVDSHSKHRLNRELNSFPFESISCEVSRFHGDSWQQYYISFLFSTCYHCIDQAPINDVRNNQPRSIYQSTLNAQVS